MKQIYYMEITVAYKKGKQTYTKEAWAVSTDKTPNEIMRNDEVTMARLRREIYKGNKTQGEIIIRKVNRIVELSKTSY